MNRSDNRYATERGTHTSVEGYREENKEILTPSPPAPPPGEESVGPALINLVQETRRAREVQHELFTDFLRKIHKREVYEQVSGTTDASGNLDLPLFQCPQGYNFAATRVNIEGGAFTPASGFSNANAWLALIRGLKFGVGSILDFGPAAAGGVIIPSIFSTSDSHAPRISGGEWITLHIVGTAGFANTSVWVRTQGRLESL